MKRDSDWETLLGNLILVALACVVCAYIIIHAPLEWWPS